MSSDKAESKLCAKCAVLRINDENLGYYDPQDGSDHPVLTYRVGWAGTGPERKYHSGRQFRLPFERTDQWPLLPSLTANASHCEFCSALRDASLILPLQGPCKIHYIRAYYERRKLDNEIVGLRKLSVYSEVQYDNAALQKVGHTLDFLVDATDGCINWLQTLQSPSDEAMSGSNVRWLKEHLHLCDQECGPFPVSDFCPTRLIEISSKEGKVFVRLVEARKMSAFSTPQYVALSYCWGNEQDARTQLKSTTHNLAQHVQDIPSETMTPVVLDAIELCRRLGIRYLWVDAICILQDDDDDWAREAVQMGSVYTNAYLTICTPATSSCRDSFLHRAAPVKVRFESKVRPGISGYLNLRHQPKQVFYCQHRSTLECEMDVGTWSTRAWTFQEEQLSKRRLYFGKSRMYLCCPMKTQVESSYSRNADTVQFQNVLEEFKNVTDFVRLYDMWIELVKDYALRGLTYQKDKFAAIAGLASQVEQLTGDVYIAGLWKEDLLRGLLWKEGGRPERETVVSRRSRATSTSTNDTFPSWSWAVGSKPKYDKLSNALNGPASSREAEWELRTECKSIEAMCDLKHFALRVSEQPAELRVQGKLLKAGSNWRDMGKQPSIPTNEWKCAINDKCVANYDLDWMVKGQENYRTGREPQDSLNVGNVYMLLLASTTGGDWKWESNFLTPIGSPLHSDSEDTDSDGGDEEGTESSDTGEGSGIDAGTLKHNKSEPFPESVELQAYEVPAQGPENNDADRHAWGLLILPIDGSDKFIRVGRFKIWAQMGGIGAFEDIPYAEVTVV
ncbi:hypothetical protein NX059_000030 [Plenodomus lindquistii]|nr:hypothetical protein NX059_000030 [Plenodomus lindquistii]